MALRTTEIKRRWKNQEKRSAKTNQGRTRAGSGNSWLVKHGMCGTRIYRVWDHMIQRCTNSNSNTGYVWYGARGITVCNAWRDFRVFLQWAISNGYADTLQIDRIDNDGNYEPGNCRFVTLAENNGAGRKRQKLGKSGFTGVTQRGRSYRVEISIKGRCINVGTFSSLSEAVEARIAAEIGYYGEQRTNLCYKDRRSKDAGKSKSENPQLRIAAKQGQVPEMGSLPPGISYLNIC